MPPQASLACAVRKEINKLREGGGRVLQIFVSLHLDGWEAKLPFSRAAIAFDPKAHERSVDADLLSLVLKLQYCWPVSPHLTHVSGVY